jgi:Tat protein translocase TatB subunit
MFGLGMPEILMILAIALIVIGPKKLPDLAKTLGRAMGEFKRSAQDFKRSIDVETTVKEFKSGIDIPNADLSDILTDPPSKDKPDASDQDTPDQGASDQDTSSGQNETDNTDQEDTTAPDQEEAATDQEESRFQDLGKKIGDNIEDDPLDNDNSDKTKNTSEDDKIDK